MAGYLYSRKAWLMKIVGFESNNSVRLGLVDGDNVIDL